MEIGIILCGWLNGWDVCVGSWHYWINYWVVLRLGRLFVSVVEWVGKDRNDWVGGVVKIIGGRLDFLQEWLMEEGGWDCRDYCVVYVGGWKNEGRNYWVSGWPVCIDGWMVMKVENIGWLDWLK